VTRLIIIRHAESALNAERRIQGHCDSGLTVKGCYQAEKLAARLKKYTIHKIYSSDLGRAYATTRAIARHHKMRVVRDPYLREINLGEWEGRTAEEVDRLYNRGYQRWLKKPSAARIPKSERISVFRRRVTGAVARIARENEGKTVVVVTHGGAITALLADWLKSDFDHILLNLDIENTSVTVAEFNGKRVRLKTINDSSHLLGTRKHDNKTYHRHS
jgi:phosphoserine phosphatase